jgi:hypothetical protein
MILWTLQGESHSPFFIYEKGGRETLEKVEARHSCFSTQRPSKSIRKGSRKAVPGTRNRAAYFKLFCLNWPPYVSSFVQKINVNCLTSAFRSRGHRHRTTVPSLDYFQPKSALFCQCSECSLSGRNDYLTWRCRRGKILALTYK